MSEQVLTITDNVPKTHKNAYNAYLATTEYLTLSLEGKNLSETLAILQQLSLIHI